MTDDSVVSAAKIWRPSFSQRLIVLAQDFETFIVSFSGAYYFSLMATNTEPELANQLGWSINYLSGDRLSKFWFWFITDGFELKDDGFKTINSSASIDE